jgi:hypothetical protein
MTPEGTYRQSKTLSSQQNIFASSGRYTPIFQLQDLGAQLSGSARPSNAHGYDWPARKEPEPCGEPEIHIERRGQPIGRPSLGNPSRGGKSERSGGGCINLRGLRMYV